MDRTLPEDTIAYARTPVFNTQTIPPKFLQYHDIKAGSWGVLTVQAGQVMYFSAGTDQPIAQITPGQTFIILPEEKHYVRITEDTEFFVEFYKKIQPDE